MLNFPGTFAGIVSGTQTLGSAAGRTITLASGLQGMLSSVRVVFITTATAGNRVLTLQALNAAAGNILFQIPLSATIPASTTNSATWAAAAPNFASGLTQVANLPNNFMLPAGGVITIFDAANIDVADTIATNIAMLV